jgi:hypothetical protein
MTILSNHKSQKRKKSSSEKLDQTLSLRRKVRITLSLENSQKERSEFEPCHQEEHTEFSFG